MSSNLELVKKKAEDEENDKHHGFIKLRKKNEHYEVTVPIELIRSKGWEEGDQMMYTVEEGTGIVKFWEVNDYMEKE